MSPDVRETTNEVPKHESTSPTGTPQYSRNRDPLRWLRTLKLPELFAALNHKTWTLIRLCQARTGAWAKRSATQLSAFGRSGIDRLYDEIVLFPLRARSHFYRRRMGYARFGTAIIVLFALLACWEGFVLWPLATSYCARLSPSTFEQVEVYLGSSISGLLAIVFALTTFAIQQVAAREAAEVVLEYAGDRRMASTYWILAAFATACFALPFVHLPQVFWPMEVIIFTLLLILTFLLIYRHFKIVMLYSGPAFHGGQTASKRVEGTQ